MLSYYAGLVRYRLVLFFCLLLPGLARAQAPAWSGVVPGTATQLYGTSSVTDMATDASGNILVTGYFTGTVTFGSTQLVSAGNEDIFLGKWNTTTGTWAWMQRGGGIGTDAAYGLAVSGTSIYLAGVSSNNNTNGYQVSYGPGNVQYGVAPGTSSGTFVSGSDDMVLIKFVDNGTSASVAWSQVAGGYANEEGRDVAVSGSSVYLTGYVNNNRANANGVLFGGSGATRGTAVQNGATTTGSNDLVVAKYTDNGTSSAFVWSQIGGGTGADLGRRLVASGSSVYVVGTLVNTTANAQGALFGGGGTVAGTAVQYGASATSGPDIVLAKYVDSGASGSLAWTQVAGGTGSDYPQGLAASGSSVYLTGSAYNNRANANAVVLGGSGPAAGTVAQYGASATASADLLLAKYTDQGSSAALTWTQIAGGTDVDTGGSLVVSGSAVYVSGYVSNNQANANAVVFGGSRTTAGTATQPGVNPTSSADMLVARYTDQGSTAAFNWSQVGGGTTADSGAGLALSGTTVYVGGYTAANRTATFGTAAGSPIIGTRAPRAVFAQLSTSATSATWQAVTACNIGGISYFNATATDAAGNLFVTGSFYGQVAFGNTVLSCGTDGDLFVAKYVPSTGTWAWAQSGGGTSNDEGRSIAVSGNNVYVVGSSSNTATDLYGVRFGGTGPTTHTAVQYGIAPGPSSIALSFDIILAKYTDNGSSATFGWSQVAGGTDQDYGYGVAASGSNVYVTGVLRNNTANVNGGILGGSGAAAGTVPQYGATATASDDIVLIKYFDNGASASVGWSQVGGGVGYDGPRGVAASGNNVYVTGFLNNGNTNSQQVLFGGSGSTPGTVQQYGISNGGTGNDILLAKYVDNGASASVAWTQVGGSANNDAGQAVAVSGNRVYVVGTMVAQRAGAGPGIYGVFGGSGTAAGTVVQYGASAQNTSDIVVAKYVDNGASASVAWTQVGGGTDEDKGQAIAVQGNGVYVVGTIKNTSANANSVVFGGSGATVGTAAQPGATIYPYDDVVVARYNDQGSSASLAWTQVAGSNNNDYVSGVAATGAGLYVVGSAPTPATFGSYTLNGPPDSIFGYIGTFGTTALPVRTAAGAGGLALYPNPTRGAATLTGITPGAAVQVLDALGQPVATAAADATGAAQLAGLAPGLYLVRAGSQVARLVVE